MAHPALGLPTHPFRPAMGSTLFFVRMAQHLTGCRSATDPVGDPDMDHAEELGRRRRQRPGGYLRRLRPPLLLAPVRRAGEKKPSCWHKDALLTEFATERGCRQLGELRYKQWPLPKGVGVGGPRLRGQHESWQGAQAAGLEGGPAIVRGHMGRSCTEEERVRHRYEEGCG